MDTFENITEGKTQYGLYEYRVITMLAMLNIANGLEMASLSLILPLIKNEWNISENMQGILGSIIFVGFFFGSISSGIVTDYFGRKKTIENFTLFQIIISIFSVFITNVYLFILIRGLFGYVVGFATPLIHSLGAEITPLRYRGKINVFLNAMFSVGIIISNILAYFCLSSLDRGNWRLLLLLGSFPPLFVWYISKFYFLESPRFIILKNSVEDGVDILDQICEINKSGKRFNQQDINRLQQWKNNLLNEIIEVEPSLVEKIQGQLKNLLNEKFVWITIPLWAAWFTLTFTAYGMVFILPFYFNSLDLSSSSMGIIGILITNLGELLGSILAGFLIDTESFGRKYTLILGEIVSAACLFLFVFDLPYFLILIIVFIIKCFLKVCFGILSALSPELYPTKIRLIGVSFAGAMGRFAAIIMPLISIRMFYISINLPFIIYSLINLIGAAGTYKLSYEPTGKSLDHIQTEDRELNIAYRSL